MGFVYVLTNPAMPGLVKTGCTNAEDAGTRIAQIHFEEMGIPVGAALRSVHDDRCATVAGPRSVGFAGEEMSTTAATRQVLNSIATYSTGLSRSTKSGLLTDGISGRGDLVPTVC